MKREDYPIFERTISGRPLIYFDNAATAQKPRAVIQAVVDFYSHHNANVHRALNPLAEEATVLYESSRAIAARFIGAAPDEIVFTRGATEGINLVARSWGEANLQAGDIVVLTIAEHHANIVPWLQLKERIGVCLKYVPLTSEGQIDEEAAAEILSGARVRLFAFTQASNVLGIVNPAASLVTLAQAKGIATLVDASQSAAHLPVNVKDLGCDFLVLSGHKLGGPTGIGVLYGRREILAATPPFLGGGDMIEEVREDSFLAAPAPRRFEAGTPNIAGAIGLGAALNHLASLGWEAIQAAESELVEKFLAEVSGRPYIKLLGTAASRLPLFSLDLGSIHPHDAADLLGQEGVIMRAGHHCAQPLHDALGLSASLRASLRFYNTGEEIDRLFALLDELRAKLS